MGLEESVRELYLLRARIEADICDLAESAGAIQVTIRWPDENEAQVYTLSPEGRNDEPRLS